jgi:hypothetical protein
MMDELDCEQLIGMWSEFADRYAGIDRERSERFRRLASQMRGILASSDRTLFPRLGAPIDVREPEPRLNRRNRRSK